jgi:hypothetical protein
VYRTIAVDRVWREYDRCVVTPNRVRFEAEHVVIAMVSYQQPSCRAARRHERHLVHRISGGILVG